ncbi:MULTISPECIES: hypothetical protein [Fibrobacteraceae]|jgi:hypothetical protein|uniref:Uncharacterized protein n=1 Tax=Hallerella porci TaxID=1945871 RepID=A0ABX5LMA1_9BACT|nr:MULTISPECIES: hypothetical protein [Fibrobacteraceae]MBR3070822.1 hypothetical protein [Fibrobacter sp.]PWK93092.1 hypothetical protein B0H50_13318 [Hallerella porci]
MDIRARLYPYPVLSADTDDYIDSEFSFTVVPQKQLTEVSLDITISLNNAELQSRIDNDDAVILIHIECSKTSFRKAIKTTDMHKVLLISNKRLNGNVSICLFVVAAKDLVDYSNGKFNEDYEGMSFNIEKGNILAIGGQRILQVTKEAEELSKIPSIFTICRAMSDNEDEGMQIDLDRDKIVITLCDDAFKNYKLLCNSTSKLPIFHAMVIIPALIYALESIRKDGINAYEGRRWFKSIRRTLERSDIKLDKDTLEMKPSYYLAQKMMESPVNKAFSAAVAEVDLEDED